MPNAFSEQGQYTAIIIMISYAIFYALHPPARRRGAHMPLCG